VIGIETNILLRLWLNDDVAQSRRIDKLLVSHGIEPGSLLVADVVLVEALWTLQSAYGQPRSDQVRAGRSLLNEPAFGFQHRATVEQAAELFANAACGFSDCLMVAQHQHLGCEFTATFDRAMGKLPGVKLL